MLIYKKLGEKGRKKIERIIVDEVKREKWVLAAFLFGSFLNRKYFRDIDIAIIPSRKVKDERLEELGWRIEEKIKIEVDIKNFFDLPLILKYFILKYGKPLYLADKNQFWKLRRTVILSYLDFKPVIELHTERLLR